MISNIDEEMESERKKTLDGLRHRNKFLKLKQVLKYAIPVTFGLALSFSLLSLGTTTANVENTRSKIVQKQQKKADFQEYVLEETNKINSKVENGEISKNEATKSVSNLTSEENVFTYAQNSGDFEQEFQAYNSYKDAEKKSIIATGITAGLLGAYGITALGTTIVKNKQEREEDRDLSKVFSSIEK